MLDGSILIEAALVEFIAGPCGKEADGPSASSPPQHDLLLLFFSLAGTSCSIIPLCDTCRNNREKVMSQKRLHYFGYNDR